MSISFAAEVNIGWSWIYVRSHGVQNFKDPLVTKIFAVLSELLCPGGGG